MDKSMVWSLSQNCTTDRNHQHSAAVALTTAVNFSEMRISNNPAETLVAFSIGSGIGIAIYDPVAFVGGLLNFILPNSATIRSAMNEKYPFMFADTGIPAFLTALQALGAKTDEMKVVIAGAAQVMDQTGVFNIGQNNYQATKSILFGCKLCIQHEDIGGIHPRTLKLKIDSGDIFINFPGRSETKI
jgi:chemotaxis protein CheD